MRIIVLDKDKKLEKDHVLELGNIDINIIDRPSFCVYVKCNDNGFNNLLFKYSNLNEESFSAEIGDKRILVNYGLISGCMYSISFKHDEYNPKEMSSLCKIIKNKNTSIRYQNNVKTFFELAKAIISEVDAKH